MNFKASGHMQSHPSLKAKIRMDPLDFDTNASGSFELGFGRMAVFIGEIGVRFAIPFLRPRRKLPLIAMAGPFHIRLSPFEVKSKGVAFRVAGTLGTKGMASEVDASVACETKMDVSGKVPAKVGKIQVDLCQADEMLE